MKLKALFRHLGAAHNSSSYSIENISYRERRLKQACLHRGEPSKIYLTGKQTYGVENIQIVSFGEGEHLFVGSFCSIADSVTVYLGGGGP